MRTVRNLVLEVREVLGVMGVVEEATGVEVEEATGVEVVEGTGAEGMEVTGEATGAGINGSGSGP